MSGADITDPEVIRTFRRQLAAFLTVSQGALGGVVNGYQRVEDELRGELQSHWKGQLRRREEAFSEANRRYLAARAEVDANSRGRGGGKQSCDEERLEMIKARNRRDEAEEKLKTIQRWLMRLKQDGDPLASLCRNHGLTISDMGEQALRTLESMSTNVEAYLDAGRRAGGD